MINEPITLSENELFERAKLCVMYVEDSNIEVANIRRYNHSKMGESILIEAIREGTTERKQYCISLAACQYGYIGKYDIKPIDKRTLIAVAYPPDGRFTIKWGD